PACILVSERAEHEPLVQLLPRCRWLEVGLNTDYEEDCVAFAAQLRVGTADAESQAEGAAPAARSGRADFAVIEIDVPDDTKFAKIKYEIHVDDRVSNGSEKRLGLNQKNVTELVEKSRKLSDEFTKAFKSAKAYARWQTDYRALGERFYKLLDTVDFKEHY